MVELERLTIVKAMGIIDKAIISIDKDKQCSTISHLAEKYSDRYQLYFANGRPK